MCKFPQYHNVNGKLSIWKCGKCSECLNEKRKDYVQRCYLELFCPKPEIVTPKFWTFTFDNYWYSQLLSGKVRGTDLWQKFEKRLRKYVCDHVNKDYPSLRFFRAAELGKETHRFHFHAIYFNLPYVPVKTMQKIWSYGYVSVEAMKDPERGICYTTKYVNKCAMSPEEKKKFGIYRTITCSRNLGVNSPKLQNDSFLLHVGDIPKLLIGSYPYKLSDYYKKKFFQNENTPVNLYLAYKEAQEVRKNYQKSKNDIKYGKTSWYRRGCSLLDDLHNLRNISNQTPIVQRIDSENRYFTKVGCRYRFCVQDRNNPPLTPKIVFNEHF